MKKRILSICLVIAMCFSLLPANASAYSETDIVYAVEGGNIYFDKAIGTITDCDETVTAAVIPETIEGVTVTSIGEKAFYYCKSLASVSIPETVTSIGPYGFYYCSALTEIDIPDAVESIGTFAFNYCHSLTSLELPASMTVIEKDAFSRMNKLESVTIPNGVTTIGDHSFYACPVLSEINIPETVTTIEQWALAQTGIVEITIPDSVMSIGNGQFYGCTKLESITLSKNITNIGDHMFYDCELLTSIEIPEGVTSIGHSAFSECDSLTSVTIPNAVTTINGSAFYGCAALASVTIGSGVTEIGYSAFSDCDSLTSMTVPKNVTTIGINAFSNSDSLLSIIVDEENANYRSDADGVLYNKDKTTLVAFPSGRGGAYEVVDGVTSIDNFAFYENSGLTSIMIPNSVKSIGNYAFTACPTLESATIGDGVTSIGEYAFVGCTKMTSVTIGKSLESIGATAFSGCPMLTDVYYNGSQEEWEARGGWDAITFGSGNESLTNATLHFHTFDENLKFTMSISAGAEMTVSYNIMGADINSYADFYLEVTKDVAGGEPITTIYGITEDREAMTAKVNPTTGEALMYQVTYKGINAKEMGDNFSTTLYAVGEDGTIYYGTTVVDSIKSFLVEKIDASSSIVELKTMAVDMLKYGAAAQVRLGYNTENLVTTDLTEEQLAYATQEIPEAVDYAATGGNGVNVNTNITVTSRVQLNLSCIYTIATDPNAIKCIITDSEGNVLAEIAATNKNNVMFSAIYENVGAKEMRDVINATFYEGETAISKTISWSVETYVAQVRAKTNATEDEINMVNAMLTYGDAVAAYMAAK